MVNPIDCLRLGFLRSRVQFVPASEVPNGLYDNNTDKYLTGSDVSACEVSVSFWDEEIIALIWTKTLCGLR